MKKTAFITGTARQWPPQKLLRIMKTYAFLFFISIMSVSAATFGQKIVLAETNVPLEVILKKIRKQSGYDLVGNTGQIKKANNVSIKVNGVSLDEALDICFKNQPLDYAIQDQTITIYPRRNVTATRADLLLQTKIGGSVKTNSGLPLAGVSIRIKGKSAAINTDTNGNFSITVAESDILVFTFVGYVKEEVKVGNRKQINVVMNETSNNLDNVVVIGYGEVKRRDLTGAVGEVNVTEMAKAPVPSFAAALAGRVAGLSVASNDGQPGEEGFDIRIRGTGSITQSSAPLYVVDGFPTEDFNIRSLEMGDIESINVLKDASATAIYGSRGANGVIIIETKKGKVGPPVVTYNGSLGFQNIRKRMEMMDPYSFVKYITTRDKNDTTYINNSTGMTLDSYKVMQGVDMQELLFRTGVTNIHSLSVRGGTAQTKYSVSGSYYGGNGVVINTGYNRYQGRFSLSQTISPKIKFDFNTNYSRETSDGQKVSTSTGSSAAQSAYLLYMALAYRPVTGKVDFNPDEFAGDFTDDGIISTSDYRVNPFISASNIYRKRFVNNLISNLSLSYKILDGLVLRVSGGMSNLDDNGEYFYNSLTAQGNPNSPANSNGQWGGKTKSNSQNFSNENTLAYTKTINLKNKFDILVGNSIQKRTTNSDGFVSTFVPNESLGIDGLGQGTPYSTSSASSLFTLQSFLGRLNYDYNSRLLITASFRADGSSKFARGHKWGYFPSGAIAWRMSNELFMKNISFISDAKLRVSYGATGNNRVSDFAYLPALNPTNSAGYVYGDNTPTQGVSISSLGNSELKWETTKQLNIGYDLSLFKERLNLVVDVYDKKTHDLLLNASLPASTGFSTVYKNIGIIQNRGLEFTVNTINVQRKNFSWESSFNISFNKNKVLALTEGQDNIQNAISWSQDFSNVPAYITKIGQPIGQMLGYIWEGNYQYSDFDEPSPGNYVLKPGLPVNNPTISSKMQPGNIKYKDLNGDGVITADDLTVIGNGLPIHTGGFTNNFTYKGFSLGVFLQWSYGNDILNINKFMFEGGRSTGGHINQFATYENYWAPDNQNNIYPRPGGSTLDYSSRIVEDGSYLRLKTLSFAYSLPVKLLKKARIKDISITAAAQNLVTWTKYSGFDPEVSTKNAVLTPGVDYSAYPQAETFVFGIKATF